MPTCYPLQYLEDYIVMPCNNANALVFNNINGNLLTNGNVQEWAIGAWYKNVNTCMNEYYQQLLVSSDSEVANIGNLLSFNATFNGVCFGTYIWDTCVQSKSEGSWYYILSSGQTVSNSTKIFLSLYNLELVGSSVSTETILSTSQPITLTTALNIQLFGGLIAQSSTKQCCGNYGQLAEVMFRYSYYSDANYFHFGMRAQLALWYQFNENYGSIVHDSSGNMNNGFLGITNSSLSSGIYSPALWNTDNSNGILFTSTNQFVQTNFPINIIDPEFNVWNKSFVHSFWANFNSSNTNQIYFARCKQIPCTNANGVLFFLILPDGSITYQLNNIQGLILKGITFAQWTHVIVGWNIQNSVITASLWINGLERIHYNQDSNPNYNYVEQATDVIQFGFDPSTGLNLNGYMRSFRIVTGSSYISDSPCIVGCSISVGYFNPICVFFSATTANCAFDEYRQAQTNECASCDIRCDGCANGSLAGCTICSSPFINAGGICGCPLQLYGDNILGTCDGCTSYQYNPIACTTCLSGTCKPCVPPCETCNPNNASQCTSCPIGYYFNNQGCLFLGNSYCPSNQNYYNATNLCYNTCPTNTYSYMGYCLELVCPVGYFVNPNVYGGCQQCSPACSSCTTSEVICNSCSTGYYYLANTCYSQCPNQYTNVGANCQLCQSPCATCSGSINTCTSCISDYYFVTSNSTCIQTCPQGNYLDATRTYCNPCTSPCNTCSGNAQYCTSCINSYYLLNNTCYNPCPIGYYSGTDGNCHQCNSPCLNCSGSATHCSSCIGGRYLNTTDNTCIPTSNGYYSDGVNLLACQIPCANCYGAATNCSTCISSYSFLSQTNACYQNCPNGYFSSGGICELCSSSCVTCSMVSTNCTSCSNISALTGNTCVSCQAPCATCQNTITNCTSCISNYNFLSNMNSCYQVCPSGYYALNGNCLPCNSPCQTCINTSNTCITCIQGYSLFSSNNTCLNNCPNGYYSNGTNCVPCQSPCLTCLSQIACTSCVSGFIYHSLTNQCLLNCPTGYYSNTNACSACAPSCSTCQNTATNCLSCAPGFLNFTANNTCLNTCPNGYYSNGTNCIACISPCATCANSITCLTCTTTYLLHLVNSSCIVQCPSGFYSNGTNCLPCITPCATCINQTACSSCIANYYFYATTNQCLSSCPKGFYQSSPNCLACSPPCAGCSVNSYNCTSCISGYSLFNNNSCILTCPSGYYTNGTTCIGCPLHCSQCNSTACLACINGYNYYASNSSCLVNCPNRYYANFGTCLSCSNPCSNCLTSAQCTNCITGYLYQSETYSCLTQCPSGFYQTSNACLPCSSPCMTCSNSSFNCNSCISNFYLFNSSTCLSQCPNGYYINGNNCGKCPSSCSTCSSLTTCLTCLSGYVYHQVNSSCLSMCPTGYYPKLGSCLPCTLPCSDCTDSKTCLACMTGYIYDPEHSSCISTCSNSTFPQAGTCAPCDKTCQTCWVESTLCRSCSTNTFLYNSTCVGVCPDGSYLASNNTCEPCDNSCKLCNGPSNQNCTLCKPQTWLYNGSCMNSCPSNLYTSNTTWTCNSTCNSFSINNTCVDECSSAYNADLKTGKCYLNTNISTNQIIILQVSLRLTSNPTQLLLSFNGNAPSLFSKINSYTNIIIPSLSFMNYSYAYGNISLTDLSIPIYLNYTSGTYVQSNTLLNLSFLMTIINESNVLYEINPSNLSVNLLEYIDMDNLSTISIKGNVILYTMTGLAQLLNYRGAYALGLYQTQQYIQLLKYLNVCYTPDIQIYQSYMEIDPGSQIDILPNYFDPIDLIYPPDRFDIFGLSSNIYNNFGSKMVMIILLVILGIFTYIMHYYSNKKQWKIKEYIRYILPLFCWNVLIMYISVNYINLTLSLLIQFDQQVQILSNEVCGMILLIGILIPLPIFTGFINTKIYILSQKTPPNVPVFFNKFLVLYHDLKTNNIYQQLFFSVSLIRGLLVMLIIYIMRNIPTDAMMLILILNIIMISYLIAQRPFKNYIATMYMILNELFVLIANIAVFILAGMTPTLQNFNQRSRIGYIIYISFNAIWILSIIYMLYVIYHTLKIILLDLKNKKKEVFNSSIYPILPLQNDKYNQHPNDSNAFFYGYENQDKNNLSNDLILNKYESMNQSLSMTPISPTMTNTNINDNKGNELVKPIISDFFNQNKNIDLDQIKGDSSNKRDTEKTAFIEKTIKIESNTNDGLNETKIDPSPEIKDNKEIIQEPVTIKTINQKLNFQSEISNNNVDNSNRDSDSNTDTDSDDDDKGKEDREYNIITKVERNDINKQINDNENDLDNYFYSFDNLSKIDPIIMSQNYTKQQFQDEVNKNKREMPEVQLK